MFRVIRDEVEKASRRRPRDHENANKTVRSPEGSEAAPSSSRFASCRRERMNDLSRDRMLTKVDWYVGTKVITRNYDLKNGFNIFKLTHFLVSHYTELS